MRGDAAFHKLMRERHGDRGFRGSLLLFSILLLLVLAFVWAAFTEIDDVSRADGRIVPSGNLQRIRAPDGGAIDRVLVNEGDVVAVDQLLMAMDETRYAGHLDQERQQAFALQARLARLRGEVDGSELKFPVPLLAAAPEIVASEHSLFLARSAELAAELDVLSTQVDRQYEAVAEAENLIASSRGVQGLVEQQISTIKPLVDRGLEPQSSLLQLQIQKSEWESRLLQASSQHAQERARLEELRDRVEITRHQFRSGALEDLTQTTAELARLAPSFTVLEHRVREAEIRSPIQGVVNRILVSSLGGIVGAGEELIEIVPLDDLLVVEAFVRPADIAFLHLGQAVNVKITAYDFSRYGALSGSVLRLGASPIPHPDRDENVFAVEIRTSTKLEDAVGQPLPIVPGMIAEVEFLSDRKSVLDYLIRPVVRVKERAFRD